VIANRQVPVGRCGPPFSSGIQFNRPRSIQVIGYARRVVRIPSVVVLVLITCFVSIGCTNVASRRQAAERVADAYFGAFGDNKIDEVMKLYDEEFFRTTLREDWRRTLLDIQGKLGRSTSHVRTGWNGVLPLSGGSFTVTLVYDVKYENGTGRETLVIKVPDVGRPTIQGHSFRSDGPRVEQPA